jgi:hypothetical protein
LFDELVPIRRYLTNIWRRTDFGRWGRGDELDGADIGLLKGDFGDSAGSLYRDDFDQRHLILGQHLINREVDSVHLGRRRSEGRPELIYGHERIRWNGAHWRRVGHDAVIEDLHVPSSQGPSHEYQTCYAMVTLAEQVEGG